MSMISHELSWWDISLVEMIQVIHEMQLIQDNQVRLANLWVDFRVIFYCFYSIIGFFARFPYFCSSHYQGGETSEKKGQKILANGSHSLALEPHQNEEKGPDFLQFINSWFLYHSEVPIDTTLNQCSGGYPHLKLSSFNISRLTFLGFPQQVDIASKKFIRLLCEVINQFGGLELNQIQFSYLVDLILHFWRAWLVYSRVKLKPGKF